MAEHRIFNPVAAGSIPARPIMLYLLFWASNLKINGTTEALIKTGDSIVVEVNIQKKDAKLSIYLDVNHNKTLDPSDRILIRGKIIDGNWDDKDEKENGYYKRIEENTFNLAPGDYIVEVDEGYPVTAFLKVLPIQSVFSISGQVKNLPNPENIYIIAQPDTFYSNEKEFFLAALCDGQGNYTIKVPETLANRNYTVIGGDLFVLHKGYMALVDTQAIFVDGEEEKDIEFLEIEEGITVSGDITDENASPLNPDSGRIAIFQLIPPDTLYLTFTYTYQNSYNTEIRKAIFGGLYMVSQFNFLYPDYMEPPPKDTFVSFNSDIEGFNIILYKADTVIKGNVYKNQKPADEILLTATDISGDFKSRGSASSGTYSDGHYEIKVSKDGSLYLVSIEVPPQCEADKKDTTVTPGSENVNFSLTCVEAINELSKIIYFHLKSALINEKDLIRKFGNFEIYGEDGRYMGDLSKIRKISSGIYFLKEKKSKKIVKVLFIK